MKSKIKAIVFDVGNVMYKEEMDYERLSRKLDLDHRRLMSAWEKYRHAGSIGSLSAESYIKSIAKEVNTDSKRLYSAWFKIKKEGLKKMPGMHALVNKLKKNRYIVGTLTNILSLHHKVRIGLRVYDPFHFNIISCKVGFRKPEKEIYELLLKKLKKLKPEEIVFIDDWKGALIPAKSLGIKTILFKNSKNLIKDLKKLGVEI